ncbi:DUF4249 domain-containing protein [Dyadobacter sp. 676]|uniref:DUF4249 domain-containing protein n=1 Tax=Dyadobacter sp. 676 TaxID=3088362 RepID=A0AAU8FTC0_9BACT
MTRRIQLVASSLFLLFACTKSVDLDLNQNMGKILVVDGQLTDLNHNNYVRLTWARNTNDELIQTVDSALVIISNQKGLVDTLVNEREIETQYDDPLFEGYYYATRLRCKVGDTYHLTVKKNGETYQADAYLPAVSPIDSVGLQYVEGYPVNGHSYLPLLYFRDPKPERNYYMTQFCSDFTSTGGLITRRYPCQFSDRIWNVAILDDEHLPEYVNGLNINVGATPSPNFHQWLSADNYTAYLYSFTADAYKYYEALIKSLNSDGGVYAPTPANAPSNLRGTAPVAGFFNASSVSSYQFVVKP